MLADYRSQNETKNQRRWTNIKGLCKNLVKGDKLSPRARRRLMERALKKLFDDDRKRNNDMDVGVSGG